MHSCTLWSPKRCALFNEKGEKDLNVHGGPTTLTIILCFDYLKIADIQARSKLVDLLFLSKSLKNVCASRAPD